MHCFIEFSLVFVKKLYLAVGLAPCLAVEAAHKNYNNRWSLLSQHSIVFLDIRFILLTDLNLITLTNLSSHVISLLVFHKFLP